MPGALTVRKSRGLFSVRFGWQKRPMQTIAATALSLAVLASFALAGGGLYLLLRRRERRQGLLMLVAAAVLFANVLLWTL